MSIILATINAKHIHSAFGLRYLYANMGELKEVCKLIEFDLKDRPALIAEKILSMDAKILGLGVYIWNIHETIELVQVLKAVQPHLNIIIGGPEVSYGMVDQTLADSIDYIIEGEADCAFHDLCQSILKQQECEKVIKAELPDLKKIKSPYPYYNHHDLNNRLIYVELSRGCPYRCEFCLSSLDIPVRTFDEDVFFDHMQDLLNRGCRNFKFVDRTFNLNMRLAKRTLQFFLDRHPENLFLHFEMVPDRLPEELRSLIKQFPHGSLQFEIGIQSFDPHVGQMISRKMNEEKAIENLTFLKHETEVHLHVDLIVGLPGDTPESFAESFDKLWHLRPDDIQVGILKQLKGTPIDRHREAYQMQYNAKAPYDLLQSKDFSFSMMQRLKRFARYIEVFANSPRFKHSFQMIIEHLQNKPFETWLSFTDWLWDRTKQEHAFSLKRQYELVYEFALKQGIQEGSLKNRLCQDFLNPESNPKGSRNGLPDAIRPQVESALRERLIQTGRSPN